MCASEIGIYKFWDTLLTTGRMLAEIYHYAVYTFSRHLPSRVVISLCLSFIDRIVLVFFIFLHLQPLIYINHIFTLTLKAYRIKENVRIVAECSHLDPKSHCHRNRQKDTQQPDTDYDS